MYTLIFLLLGVFFLLLAIRGFRRAAEWVGADRLKARVCSVQYTAVHGSENMIEDSLSSAAVTLECTFQDHRFKKTKIYRGILTSPRLNETVPIYYKRIGDSWIPQKEVTPWWILFSLLGLLCLVLGIAFLFNGQRILVELSDYHVESPNLSGNIACILGGILSTAGAVICAYGLLPFCLRPIFEPVFRLIRFSMGRYEEINARCTDLIHRTDADSNPTYFPLFTFPYHRPVGTAQWYSEAEVRKKKYQTGRMYPLYRDVQTGIYSLKPDGSDAGRFLLAFLLLIFCLGFVLAIAGLGIGLIWCGVSGF